MSPDDQRILDLTPWITPAMAARIFHRSEQTIRLWMRQGIIPSACVRANHILVVYWPTVDRVSEATPRRLRPHTRTSVLK